MSVDKRKKMLEQMRSDCKNLCNDLTLIFTTDQEFLEINAANKIFIDLELPSIFQDMADRTEKALAVESMEIMI